MKIKMIDELCEFSKVHFDYLLEYKSKMSQMTDERSTPMELFKELNDEFHFEVDVCALQDNFKCERYFHPAINGLIQKWAPSVCFMNPPYSQLPFWLRKARSEANDGATVVCILPVDSSTKWFHEFIWDRTTNKFRCEIRFPNKRYSFGEYSNSAKFATMIAIFRKYDMDK